MVENIIFRFFLISNLDTRIPDTELSAAKITTTVNPNKVPTLLPKHPVNFTLALCNDVTAHINVINFGVTRVVMVVFEAQKFLELYSSIAYMQLAELEDYLF